MENYINNSQTMQSVQKIPTKLNELVSTIISKISDILNTPTAEQINKINWSDITAILGTISIILIVSIIFLVSLYLLKSFALYTMVKRKNKGFAWLAFVPFGCLFTYGLILEKTKIFGIEIDHPEYLLPSLLITSCMPFVGCIGTILFILAYFAFLYRVYQTKTPNFAVVLLILSIIVPLLSPIILFAIRNK